MEGLSSVNNLNSSENGGGNKADCYFYYYSSCNKGNACPFRHEPSALRNETMCVYWLKGSCNKPHCIYRHMEITKNRNKIPCFFESQPGGCKKLHCPFFHNDVLKQPREEDVPNKPDLILPVKDSEPEYETEESELKKLQDSVASQLKIQRKLCESQTSVNKERETSPDIPIPIIRKSFIVPLHDGESDSESVDITPVKSSEQKRRCVITSSESDWELERLKEIQREESNLLGYSFCDEDSSMPSMESQFQEDIPFEDEEYFDDRDDTSYTLVKRSFEIKPAQQFPLSRENLGLFAKRVIGDTLISNNRIDEFSLKASPNSELDMDSNRHLGRKIRLKRSPAKKISVKERLGKRSSQETNKASDIVLTNKKEDPVKTRLSLHEGNIKKRIKVNEEKLKVSSTRNDGANLIIKSLAEIKAEKSKPNGKIKRNESSELLPLAAYIDNNRRTSKDSPKAMSVQDIKIKTLEEIRAEKRKQPVQNESKHKISLNNSKVKRPYSPIRLDSDSSKKQKLTKTTEIENQKPLSSAFQPRKLSIRKTKSISNNKIESINSSLAEANKTSSTLNIDKNTLCIEELNNRTNNHQISTERMNNSKDSLNTNYNIATTKRMNSCKDSLNSNCTKATTVTTITPTLKKRKESIESLESNHQVQKNRLDSFIDEDELLLLDESDNINIDVDDIDEEELLS